MALLAALSGCAALSSAEQVPPGRSAEAILVTPQPALDRVTELVGVLDFHAPADTEDKGFAALRERAARLGADAVVGAEFEHGEDGGLSHLSGMAVRYGEEDPRPFEILGEIDVVTAAGAADKGHGELRARAAAMGADEIREIRFEHGEDGEPSHLRGVAVRHWER